MAGSDMQQQPVERLSAQSKEPSVPAILPAATKTERFLLTAADQESGSRDERLNRVIQAKYEAGLLKPYNYVKGYARLSRWMDRKFVQGLEAFSLGCLEYLIACRKTRSSRSCNRCLC